jgi:hypothetical protein
MGEGLFQPLHILLIIGIALLVFGTSKFAALGNGRRHPQLQVGDERRAGRGKERTAED